MLRCDYEGCVGVMHDADHDENALGSNSETIDWKDLLDQKYGPCTR